MSLAREELDREVGILCGNARLMPIQYCLMYAVCQSPGDSLHKKTVSMCKET